VTINSISTLILLPFQH